MRSHLKASDEENDGPLLSVEELLGDAGRAQGLQHAVSSVDYGSRRADSAAEHSTPIDCDNAPTAGAKGDGDKSGETDGRSGVRPSSDGWISTEQGAEHGAQQGPPNTSATSVPGPKVRCVPENLLSGDSPANRWPRLRDFALPENTQSSLSDPPPPPPPPPPPLSPPPPPPPLPADTVLSSRSDKQTDSRDSVLKDIGLRPSGEGKKKADTDDGHNGDGHKRDGDRMATGATGIQDFSKRTADNAGLNEGGEDVPRSEKIRRTGSSTGPNRYISRLMIFERPYRRDR